MILVKFDLLHQVVIKNIRSSICYLILKFKGVNIKGMVALYGKLRIIGYGNNIIIGKGCSMGNNIKLVVNKNGNLIIGDNTLLSDNVNIMAGNGKIFIGSNLMIAANSYIINNDHDIFDNLSVRNSGHIHKDVVIEDNCWIGANVAILKGVTIGEGSIVGAGSIVNKSIPPFCIAVGNPCRVIKKRFEDEVLRDKLLKDNRTIEMVEKCIKDRNEKYNSGK